MAKPLYSLINFSSSLWKFQNKWKLHIPMNIDETEYSGPATLTELSSIFICPIQKWMFPHGNGASSYLALSWVSVERAPKEVTVLWALSTYSVESPTDESELPYPWTDQKSMIYSTLLFEKNDFFKNIQCFKYT